MEQEEMSFWDHLEELRWTLFRSILALFIFAIGSFAFMRGSNGLFDRVVLAPCNSDFIFYRWLCNLNQWLVDVSPWFDVLPDFCNDDFHVDIINIKMASQFFTHMSTSFWLALVLTFPYLMWEIWKFIRPAVGDNHVFHRLCHWLFHGFPDDIALFDDVPVEYQYCRTGVVGFLYGQFLDVDFHHGDCVRDAAAFVVAFPNRDSASFFLPEIQTLCYRWVAGGSRFHHSEQ